MDLIEINENSSKRHPWELARKIIVTKFISKLKNSNIKILDVGSGDAYLANSFTINFENSYCYCVDTAYTETQINKINSDFSNKKLKLHASLNDLKVPTIDIVTLLDVIEHVPSDVDFLNSIINQSFIKEDTYFIISVPAYQTLYGKHDVALKHYRRYNLKKLKQTITKSNLNYIDGGYFFSSLLIPRAAQLIMEKMHYKKDENLDNLGNWEGNNLITFIIKNILLFDYYLSKIFKAAGINVPGLSCYVICSKNSLGNKRHKP